MIDKELAIERAELARQIAENPLFVEAVTAIKAKMFSDFTSTKWRHRRLRDEIWRKFQALDAIESALKSEMASGKIAAKQLKQR